MSEPPAPSWPVAAADDPHRRPEVLVLATAIAAVWSLAVLVLAVRFALHPTAQGWRHADPTGLLPHGHWWRWGLAAGYAVWCALALWFAAAAFARRRWAAVALAVSSLLAFALAGYELRTVVDVPVPLGALTTLLLLAVPAVRTWYAARED
ncbi:hypothetical protein D9V37_03850 [Nocardioides mangrovicus]|uniref:Uncharacterized protein n=1 Tax=Nocardioides mangrovicus TaxID=2478913 RepID=A0A3L8P7F0_9ACTN|nr:hypothetical protein [Nocardioides mangrovicus]RLV51064.1 hypothetical protein D9V37_03850 [Nocardioides mangrovicus]